MIRSKYRLLVLVALILLGFALRLYNINRVSLRGDEAFTVLHWMREPLSHTLAEIATVDPQPPLAYAIYRLWALAVGSGEYVVRFLPALLNLIGIPALYALGKEIGGWRLGLMAAFLWAIHPAQIWHAQDARNYAIWGALSPLALWLALRLLRLGRRVDWVLYVVAAALAAYIYYLELFFLAALNLYVMLTHWRNRPVVIRWLLSQAVVALLLAPWYLQERLLFSSGYGGTAARFNPLELLVSFVPDLVLGETAVQLWPLVFTLLFVGWLLLWQQSRRGGVLLLLLGVLPLLFLSVVSLRLNVFVPRYVLPLSGVYVLLLASLCVFAWSIWSLSLQIGVGLMLVLLSVMSYRTYCCPNDYAKSPDWRSLSVYLQTELPENSMVIQRSADMAFNFYYREYVRDEEPFQLPANPTQSTDEIETILASQSAQSYWLLAQPPDWDNASVPLDWLNDYTQLVRWTNINGLEVRHFMPWEVTEIIPQPLANFDGVVELVGQQNSVETNYRSSPILNVWLYWRPLSPTDQPLKVFVHLVGGINPATGTTLWSQHDDFPQGGRIATADWIPGELYRDIYTLPLSNLPQGEYQVVVGFYDPQTGERLPVNNGDTYPLTTITLPAP
jgi:hypothetical protein